MRITLLLLAAGLSVAVSGGAAAAEIATGSMARSGGSHGGWKSGGWGLGFNPWQPRRDHPGRGHGRPWNHDGHDRHDHDRPGHHDGHDRHDRHGDHDRGRGDRDHAYGYGAGGIAGPFEAVDPYGTGFFAGAGGEIRLRGGRPRFDYDRSYPYEWASVAGGRPERVVEDIRAAAPPGRCTMENGVRVCRGW